MRLSLATILLASALSATALEAQAMDQTLVPRGQLRLQAHPVFDAWHARFGRAEDGTRSVENLGEDLTDPTMETIFPGLLMMRSAVRGLTGISDYEPVLGSSQARISQDLTRVDLGGHLGVFDWLTVGVIVPWVRSRTAIDVLFEPDTIGGDLGLNPRITDPASADVFLESTLQAATQASANATAVCAGGAGAACTTAQGLADRAAAFDASIQAAYGASPFFPLVGTPSGTALAQAAAALNTDLTAAGLPSLTSIALANEVLTSDGFLLLPQVVGAGIDAGGLITRKGLWGRGDAEVSARVRLLDNLAPREGEPRPRLGYRVTAHGLVRLPTGATENPEILLDIGTGDAQTDMEGGLATELRFGRRLGLYASGFYGEQRATDLLKRVAPPEQVLAPASTLRSLRWKPGFYIGGAIAPAFFVSRSLVLHGEYRFFQKGRDAFELTTEDAGVDPTVLSVESGMKVHQYGGGLRYDTVEPWLKGEASKPLEIHLRWLTTTRGSGGQTPKTTRVEWGVRLFRRFWGPER